MDAPTAAMEALLDEDLFIPLLIAIAVIFGMLIQAVKQVAVSAARERSRREIAAYIAEGSMTPEQGERLLRADVSRGQVPS